MDTIFDSSFEICDLIKSVRIKLAPIKPRARTKPARKRKEKQPDTAAEDADAKVCKIQYT